MHDAGLRCVCVCVLRALYIGGFSDSWTVTEQYWLIRGGSVMCEVPGGAAIIQLQHYSNRYTMLSWSCMHCEHYSNRYTMLSWSCMHCEHYSNRYTMLSWSCMHCESATLFLLL